MILVVIGVLCVVRLARRCRKLCLNFLRWPWLVLGLCVVLMERGWMRFTRKVRRDCRCRGISVTLGCVSRSVGRSGVRRLLRCRYIGLRRRPRMNLLLVRMRTRVVRRGRLLVIRVMWVLLLLR